MFTGIIEQVGTISAVEPLGDSVRLTIDAPAILDGVALGDSIAVNGVCLTVAEHTATTFTADCMQETLDRSNLGELHVGSPVNLERAALVNARLDGHIVQGHVDATTALPPTLARYIVEKGSIAINGTSLTVSALGDDYFEVSLIPITLRDTIFGKLAVGGTVNLEVDVLAKYVERNLTFRT